MCNKAFFIISTALISLLSAQTLIATTVVGSTPAEFNVVNGTATYSISLDVPPGRGGMQPELSLNYSSSSGNGVLGLGWNLGGLSAISRCPATLEQDGFIGGINFDEKDRYCLDGQRLIPINGVNGGIGTEYRTEIDTYSQIISVGGFPNNPESFIVKTKAGQVIKYGGSGISAGRSSLNLSQGTLSWAAREIRDTTGKNLIEFAYYIDQNTQYLSAISYHKGFVDIFYEPRPDTSVSYIEGNKIVLSKRVAKVITYYGGGNTVDTMRKEYRIGYDNTGFKQVSKVDSITTCDKFGNCFKDTRFGWKTSLDNKINFPQSTMDGLETVIHGDVPGVEKDISRINFGDFNGDGRTDIYQINGGWGKDNLDKIYLFNEDGTYRQTDGPETILKAGDHPGVEIDISRIKFGDFDGDGRTDIYEIKGWDMPSDKIHLSNGDGTYKLIDGPKITGAIIGNADHEGLRIDISRINFGDFDGDGRTDIYHIRGGWNDNDLDKIYLSNGDGTYRRINGPHKSVGAGDHSGVGIEISRIKFEDFNGDGRTDIYQINGGWGHDNRDKIYLSNGNDTYGPHINGPVTIIGATDHPGVAVGIARIQFGDFNGDGLTDIYQVNGGWSNDNLDKIYLSKGNGSYEPPVPGLSTELIASSHDGVHAEISRFKFLDLNSDGKTDIYQVNVGSGVTLDTIHLSNGDGTFTVVDGVDPHLGGDKALDISRIKFGDFNGDGKQDLYYINGWNKTVKSTIYLNNYVSTELKTITDSNDNVTYIDYKPLTDSSVYTKGTGAEYPVRDLQYPQYVVSQVDTSNGIGGITTVQYYYEGLKAHLRGRGSYGFASITEFYPDTDKTQITTFYQSRFPYIGSVKSVEEYYNDQLINESFNNYYRIDGPPLFAYYRYGPSRSTLPNVYRLNLSFNSQKSYELGNDTDPITTVITEYKDIDAYGNIGMVKVNTAANNPITNALETFTKTTYSNYANYTDGGNWLLGRLEATVVKHQAPDQADKYRGSLFEYNQQTGLLTAEHIVPANTGNISGSGDVVGLDSSNALTTTTYIYDPYGQKTQVTLSAAGEQDRVTTTTYYNDGKPKKVCNAYNQCETYTYYSEGWLKTTTGPNNITTRWTYDGFGRKLREDRADGTWTTTNRYFADSGNCGDLLPEPFTAYTCAVTQSSGTQPSIVQFDRLGREVRRIKQSFDDRQVYSDTEYNYLNQVSRVSRDYYPGDQIYWATSEYDALDRVIRMTEPGPNGTTNEIITQYNGLTTTVISGPEARAKTTITNALGQKVRINEEEGAYTAYIYNSDGNLRTTLVAGVQDTKITLSYDEFGRKIGMDDPDMGRWSYTYNAFGELVSQTDAKGQTVTMEYDLLGRMIRRTEPEGVSVWTYGGNGAAPGSIGKLLQEVGHGVMKDYTYDSLGRLTGVTTSIDGEGSFTSHTEYDNLGRVSRTTYPGTQGFFTENVYNNNGFLSAIQGLRSQAESHDYSQLQPLMGDAVSLADEYLEKARELKRIGEFYQTRIDNYSALLAGQTIQFESGTTAGLSRNVAYDYLYASDGITAYIRVPDALVPVDVGSLSFVIVQAEYHYRVQDTGGSQTITQITAAEFDAIEATLTDRGDHIYAISDNTITRANDGHDQYVAELQRHKTILQETITQSQNTEIDSFTPTLYQTKITNHTNWVDRTIEFEGGTTAGLSQNIAYDYLHADDGITSYIRVPDTVTVIRMPGTGINIPIVPPAEYHYRVQDDGSSQTITQITAAEFDAIEATLTDSGDQIYVLSGNTIALPPEAVITQSQTTSSYTPIIPVLCGNIMIPIVPQQKTVALPPELLSHINNTLVELQAVQSLINQQAQSYADTFNQLVVLTEQTLATADHNFQFVRTLDHSTSAYGDMIADNDRITYWQAVDVDASGRISAEVYGNGIVNDYAYNQATGQLQSIHSGLLASNPIRHLEYQYDAYQNVTLRHDWVNDIRETYSYDRLDSLVSSTVRSDFYDTPTFNSTQSLTYDVLGNITSKSDVGEYTYNGASPHAVTQAGGNTYTYDANGNMESGAGRNVQWSSFNKPTQITQNGRSATFSYGSDRSRYKKVNHMGDSTLYIGGLYEKTTRGDNVEQKHYIFAAGQLVAEHILSTEHDVQTRYLHKDALGSVDLVTDAYANVVERRGFDPWGKLRELPWQSYLELNDPFYLTQLPFTDRGYTGHEHIQEVGLIHMNGRVYDPTLARFMSADPHIQAGSLSQNYNRYSYVMNNPMKYTDPSGYFFKKLFKSVRNYYSGLARFARTFVRSPRQAVRNAYQSYLAERRRLYRREEFQVAMQIGALFIGGPWAAAAVSAANAAYTADAYGASPEEALEAGLRAGATTYFLMETSEWIGVKFKGQRFKAAALHGSTGGIASVVNGGKFGHGFASSFFVKTVSGEKGIGAIAGNNRFAGATIAALIGGTASELGGGKFANGARTAAIQYLYNEVGPGRKTSTGGTRGGEPTMSDEEVYEAFSNFGNGVTAAGLVSKGSVGKVIDGLGTIMSPISIAGGFKQGDPAVFYSILSAVPIKQVQAAGLAGSLTTQASEYGVRIQNKYLYKSVPLQNQLKAQGMYHQYMRNMR